MNFDETFLWNFFEFFKTSNIWDFLPLQIVNFGTKIQIDYFPNVSIKIQFSAKMYHVNCWMQWKPSVKCNPDTFSCQAVFWVRCLVGCDEFSKTHPLLSFCKSFFQHINNRKKVLQNFLKSWKNLTFFLFMHTILV